MTIGEAIIHVEAWGDRSRLMAEGSRGKNDESRRIADHYRRNAEAAALAARTLREVSRPLTP
jgi:hypothetical protein